MTESELVDLLKAHHKSGGWAYVPRGGTLTGGHRLGRWSCSCGAYGAVHKGEQVTELHRRHLARVILQRVTP